VVSFIFLHDYLFIFLCCANFALLLLLKSAAVLSFDEEVSKTISLEQYKWMAVNEPAETKNKNSSDKRDMPIQEKESSVARVSGPRPSTSAPRQSKKSVTASRTPRSSAAHSIRGTYVKSKTGFSKYGCHPPPSSSSSSLSKCSSSPSSSRATNQSISHDPFAPKMASNSDAFAVDLSRHVDDITASFSQLFAGSYPYWFCDLPGKIGVNLCLSLCVFMFILYIFSACLLLHAFFSFSQLFFIDTAPVLMLENRCRRSNSLLPAVW